MTNRGALGFGLLGLGIGILVFSVVYFVTVRVEQVAVRGSGLWILLFLACLLGPALLLALYGATRPHEA